jgi:hypothetical protein
MSRNFRNLKVVMEIEVVSCDIWKVVYAMWKILAY